MYGKYGEDLSVYFSINKIRQTGKLLCQKNLTCRMPTWEKLDEIDAGLEHPLQKSPTFVAQKMGQSMFMFMFTLFPGNNFQHVCKPFMEVPGMRTEW